LNKNMNNLQFEIILYVSDQSRSAKFYSAILRKGPSLDVPGMTEFMLTDKVRLGLMPNSGIVKILKDKTPHPAKGNGIPRCELYVISDNPHDDLMNAVNNGAIVVSEVGYRDWGDYVGYVADPDGHIIAFAKSAT